MLKGTSFLSWLQFWKRVHRSSF